MDKKEIIKKLIEKGIIPTPENIKKATENGFEFLSAEKVSGERKPVEKRKDEIEFFVKEAREKEKISAADVANFYKNRYEKIRKILLEKVDAVSINKLKNIFSEVSVIGMVSEKTQSGFLLEDLTGQIEVVSKEEVDLDDVIAVKGYVRENKIFATEIIYPDIPFNRKIGKIKASVLLTRKVENTKSVNDVDIIITPREIINEERKIDITNNPAFIKLKKGNDELSLLIFEKNKDVEMNEPLSILKKRYFPIKRNEIKWSIDPNIIEEVPDIFWITSKDSKFKVHKGVLLIFAERAKVDMETKEVEFN